ncbi:hypothetical protein GW17_00053871 [Ensete ventricosum]|uniref:Uncharacterized protein n=1 Tax=Ensete ventricosum TaxID=4639 RepID=A0A444CET4_ENSVE|nr:hypothetical protein GW17_00053871 [Ensete ventricosum]RZR72042.1 hypothetical protein BHM03_00009863 [Ensete ventricosum]
MVTHEGSIHRKTAYKKGRHRQRSFAGRALAEAALVGRLLTRKGYHHISDSAREGSAYRTRRWATCGRSSVILATTSTAQGGACHKGGDR